MESFEEIADEEVPKEPRIYVSQSLRRLTREILATKTQNCFTQTKRTEITMIQIAFSIGLDSIWRFPYLCHRNGGGSFILVYFFMLLLFGIPLLYIEMIMEQWLRVDNVRIWKQLVPWLGGIGYASIMVCILVSLYNSVIIVWSLSYLSHSFDHPLPWNECPLVKNINVTDLSCLRTVSHQYFWYHTTLSASGHIEEGVKALVLHLTLGIFAAWFLLFLIMITGLKVSIPMLIFSVFLLYILLCLFIRSLFLEGAIASLRRMVTIELSAWASLDLWRQAGSHVLYSLGLGMGTIINLSSCKTGGSNYAQVASLMALVNLVTSLLATSIIFIVLGFWAATSGHACVEKGVSKLMKLIDDGVLPQDAKPPENILLQPPLDYLDWISNLPRHLQDQVIRFSPSCSIKAQKEKFMEGPGLAFAAFSQVVSLFPASSLWAILFFLTLAVTELSTLIRILEGIVVPFQNSIFRNYPQLLSGTTDSHPSENPALLPPVPRSPPISRARSTPDPALHIHLSVAKPASALAVVCLGGFLGSFVFTSRPGSYIMSLFDDRLVPLTLITIVAFQNVALAWIYGAKRFREEISSELGHFLWSFFTFLLCYMTLPGLLALLIICLIQLYQRVPPYYIAWNSSVTQEVKQPYPQNTLGWVTFLSILTLLPIPVHPLYQWWHLQDHIASERFEKPLSKKMPLAPIKHFAWPKHRLVKSNFKMQEGNSESSLKAFSLTLDKGPDVVPLRQSNLPSSVTSQDSSWLSLPRISSLTSMLSIRSASLVPSRQVSPISTEIDNSDKHGETKENHKKSVQ
ncbi:orphan sodium- and chloride-dependent neurotransmitter transporter NTT5-like isoform X1 [Equus caballus]|uniref:orphan sodium- and chloride-dependent neurotransmitter transporter NTT5-like isoform X1 n=1 Tax=Equus caballus TaxID=9796 RepID=UPI000C9E244C|nr:orphan sodium- and chloride-dependent neurotransmitter transporter NTT5-like isoform X1 [Equus caballus]XP_023505865.1 orphan sodium- and chloride-dependent neurotransmitter transporter NTT5-like isoform X1 [Equus caballus]XP_023505866.1 orphan sodium- and chloride-dependent neurotransmitter transporter NTT5-like isoform X1 [Equus caballus]XP_023505867.1 orphan sodium- and chloride-dependent neurotransmitter transporter NTT5-like isoform X1 [Equus caballus]XP_023505868.1 orphan sodium- and c